MHVDGLKNFLEKTNVSVLKIRNGLRAAKLPNNGLTLQALSFNFI
jgi:hypothetical protein